MKKSLLLIVSIAMCLSVIAQVEQFPVGFQRAKVPAHLNKPTLKPIKKSIDNPVPYANAGAVTNAAPVRPPSLMSIPFVEYGVGLTYYDLQTNNSISNRLVLADDGSITAAWTTSPNNIQTPIIFPQRGSGYNYSPDGVNWLACTPCASRAENVRTGFTNIVVTQDAELLIAHSIVTTTGDSNRISVTRRSPRGTGTWSPVVYPWGNAFDTWPKATSAGSSGLNNNVYVIFQGSGAGAATAVDGMNGPLYFAKSTDGGVTWGPKVIIPQIDSTQYAGFGGDSYSITARGDTVAITVADTYTDVILLKSFDAGVTWTKHMIQRHPIPFYAECNCTTNYQGDSLTDTVFSNSGDSKVLLDHNGMAHVWFSRWDYMDDDSSDNLYLPFDNSDDLFYWNESMNEDTIGGARSYVSIATAQDFSGNGFIDVPSDTFTNCANRNPWGDYAGGITQMPSAGIDETGRLYMTYQTINESADTTYHHAAHRHIYIKTLAPDGSGNYNAADWTYPVNILATFAQGGEGEIQEGVFACTAERVDANYAYVLYQRDAVPGHALAADGTCDKLRNAGNTSDIILTLVDRNDANGIKTTFNTDYVVGQNYPNPAHGITYINIGMKKSANVKMEVTDVVGKIVYAESYGMMQSGTNTVQLNTANWDSGIYTYTVTANGERRTHRMIVN